jgi:hypothetical protein
VDGKNQKMEPGCTHQTRPILRPRREEKKCADPRKIDIGVAGPVNHGSRNCIRSLNHLESFGKMISVDKDLRPPTAAIVTTVMVK